ncbi:uncharacterized protein LOC125472880 [Pyrus x bretschneideri]|uniref:uncharacterized protein LOC125472880 n=1 Tax=Pyrus x bretschneideri TaxID=225117 RepID=UPI00202F413E|nr:uncharacterized protein LOC125472880 [Pyrus x bretschneideri]
MNLPRARYAWTHLMIQDFKSAAEYNSQQYRTRCFTEYNQLIFVLLVAEQSNEILMKNHQSRPTGSAPFSEVNVASLEVNTTSSGGDNHKRGRGHKLGWWNRKGKNHGGQFHNQIPRCGGDGHWTRTYHTPKHLMDLYQASLKEKSVKTNFLDQARLMDIPDPMFDLSGQLNTTHLNVSDFIVERGNEVYRSD